MITIEELVKMTIPQLKSYAKKNNINLDGVSTKPEILETIGSFIPSVKKSKPVKSEDSEKVALYSARNLHWTEVGNLEKGYHIVSKEESEKWLRHKAVRIAEPLEIARFYGKA